MRNAHLDRETKFGVIDETRLNSQGKCAHKFGETLSSVQERQDENIIDNVTMGDGSLCEAD